MHVNFQVRIAQEGVNGNLSGSKGGIQSYIKRMNSCEFPSEPQSERGIFAGVNLVPLIHNIMSVLSTNSAKVLTTNLHQHLEIKLFLSPNCN